MDGLPTATGWQMKPQGGGPGELCVPLPSDRREGWIADVDDWGWFCYSEFADMIGQRYVRDDHVWSLGSVPEVRRVGLEIDHNCDMTTPNIHPAERAVPAGQFKTNCLRLMDEVRETGTVIVVTNIAVPS